MVGYFFAQFFFFKSYSFDDQQWCTCNWFIIRLSCDSRINYFITVLFDWIDLSFVFMGTKRLLFWYWEILFFLSLNYTAEIFLYVELVDYVIIITTCASSVLGILIQFSKLRTGSLNVNPILFKWSGQYSSTALSKRLFFSIYIKKMGICTLRQSSVLILSRV